VIPYHRLDGPDDADVVLLSNSLGTPLAMWEPQMPALTKRYRVLRYDRRGHGCSDVPPAPYTPDDFGGDVIELLDSLELERVSFCGLSMGGMVGMWIAANAPDRVDRLVLACTAAWFGPPETWTERAALVRSGGMESVVDSVLERWFSPGFRQERPAEVEEVRGFLLSTPPEGYAACCEAIGLWDFRPRLGEVRAPTLVLAGSADPATPPERAEEIAAGIPGARVRIFEGSAHLANIEQPEAFNDAILDHLREEAG
jgi:3-oxoadipate enol-lactonase